jgi:hypothetical protein
VFQNGMVCCIFKVKKKGPNHNRLLYHCDKEDIHGFFEYKQPETSPRLINKGIILLVEAIPTYYLCVFLKPCGQILEISDKNAQE